MTRSTATNSNPEIIAWQARRAAAEAAARARNIRLAAERADQEAAWAAKTESESFRKVWQRSEMGRYSLAGMTLHYSETIVLTLITLGNGQQYTRESIYRDSQLVGGSQYPASEMPARIAQLTARS